MTGDFLFNGDSGVGRDDLPGGSLEAHWEALSVLQRFDDETLVLSGHAPRVNLLGPWAGTGATIRSSEWHP